MRTNSSRTSKRKPKATRATPKIVPVSTVSQSRGCMFAATKALGKLRRIHRDVLDYLIAMGKPTRTDQDNVIAHASVAGFFRAKGKSDGSKSRKWLEQRVTEIVETAITVGAMAPGKTRVIESILTRVEFRTTRDDTCVMVVWFGNEYLQFVASDMHVNSERLVLAVLKIRHDVTAMVVRWLLSHSVDQRHSLDDLIHAVGVPLTAAERTMRKHRAHILDEAAYLEREFGITVVTLEDGRTGLDYPRHQAVWCIDPVKWRADRLAERVNNGTKIQGAGTEIQSERHENPGERHEIPAA